MGILVLGPTGFLMFIHLRCKSAFTFGQSLLRPAEIADLAADEGMPAVAMVDRNFFGAMEFARQCAKRGIKAIHGLEILLQEEQGPGQGWPLALLAWNSHGYENLLALSARFDQDARGCLVPHGALAHHAGGLIALGGGRGTRIRNLLAQGEEEEAVRELHYLHQTFFHECLYLEIPERPPAPDPDFMTLARILPDLFGTGDPAPPRDPWMTLPWLAREHQIPMVATRLVACRPGTAYRLQPWRLQEAIPLAWSDPGYTGMDTEWLSERDMAQRFDPEALAASMDLAHRIEPLNLHRRLFTVPSPQGTLMALSRVECKEVPDPMGLDPCPASLPVRARSGLEGDNPHLVRVPPGMGLPCWNPASTGQAIPHAQLTLQSAASLGLHPIAGFPSEPG